MVPSVRCVLLRCVLCCSCVPVCVCVLCAVFLPPCLSVCVLYMCVLPSAPLRAPLLRSGCETLAGQPWRGLVSRRRCAVLVLPLCSVRCVCVVVVLVVLVVWCVVELSKCFGLALLAPPPPQRTEGTQHSTAKQKRGGKGSERQRHTTQTSEEQGTKDNSTTAQRTTTHATQQPADDGRETKGRRENDSGGHTQRGGDTSRQKEREEGSNACAAQELERRHTDRRPSLTRPRALTVRCSLSCPSSRSAPACTDSQRALT